MEYFSRTTIPALSVSFSVHESKLFFVLAVSALFLSLDLLWGWYGCSSPATKVIH